ncbi:MAG: hypothetical protein ABIV21_07465 [Pyrinomonadaceae bacterium]
MLHTSFYDGHSSISYRGVLYAVLTLSGLCYNPHLLDYLMIMVKSFPRFRSIIALFMLTASLAATCAAQAPTPQPPLRVPTPTPQLKGPTKVLTAEQAVESAIYLYGFPGGRLTLDQIRKTTLERGSTSITDATGKVEQANYQRSVIRGGSLDKEKVRLDQEFRSARYSLVFGDGRIFGVYNNTVFTPRDDASKTFENQIVHGLEALLRYKENESKLELVTREKLLGVEYFVVDVTDKLERKTRFYLSAKSFRVMMLTYDDGGVKYRRRFYDYNYAQGTLVPFRTVLWADDKIIEETEVGTITFGQKVDENLFNAS